MKEEFKPTPEELANIFAGHPIDPKRCKELTDIVNECYDQKKEYLDMANKVIGINDFLIIQSMIQTERDINDRYATAIKAYTNYMYGSIVKPAVNAYAPYIDDPKEKLTETDICCLVVEYMEETRLDKYLNKANADEVLTFAIDDFMNFVQKRYPEYKPNTSRMFENEKTVVPDNALIITDKGYTGLFNGNETGLFHADLGGSSKHPITRIIQLDYSELDDVLEEKDKSVSDAIVTHVVAGNTYISYQMIYRVMTRNPEARLTPEMTDWNDIDTSMRKLIRTIYKADISDEVRAYSGMKEFQVDIEEPVIIGRIISSKTLNGQRVNSILQVFDEPIVYRLAKAKGQIESVPMKQLRTPPNKSKLSLRVTDYLERFIIWKKHDNAVHEKRAITDESLPRQFPVKDRTLLLSTLADKVLEKEPADPTPEEMRKYKARIKKAKQRLPLLIAEKLTAYSQITNGLIEGYVMDSERIRFAFNSEQVKDLKRYDKDGCMSYLP